MCLPSDSPHIVSHTEVSHSRRCWHTPAASCQRSSGSVDSTEQKAMSAHLGWEGGDEVHQQPGQGGTGRQDALGGAEGQCYRGRQAPPRQGGV